jgi:hypothetical protein
MVMALTVVMMMILAVAAAVTMAAAAAAGILFGPEVGVPLSSPVAELVLRVPLALAASVDRQTRPR